MDMGDPVAVLSELHLPTHEVRKIYATQLNRLAAEARIDDFIAILAVRNARAILRANVPQSDARHDGVHPDEDT